MEKKTSAKKAPAKKTVAAPKKKKLETAAKAPRAAKKTAPRARMAGKSCQVKSCKRAYRAKGYCKPHYRQWRHGKFSKARYTSCKDYGCHKPMAMNRHGYCEDHYQSFYVKGMEPTHAPVAAPAKEAKTDKAAETAA
ncbi:hypothetical protein K2X33_10355 [bacterium]|nr:hypothetical protein [bacterium]